MRSRLWRARPISLSACSERLDPPTVERGGDASALPRMRARDIRSVKKPDGVSEEVAAYESHLLADSQETRVFGVSCRSDPSVVAAAHGESRIVAGIGTGARGSTASRASTRSRVAASRIRKPSAYTFAYFGEVAGREMERAARYGRRFALLTLSIKTLETQRSTLSRAELVALQHGITDAILEAVKDRQERRRACRGRRVLRASPGDRPARRSRGASPHPFALRCARHGRGQAARRVRIHSSASRPTPRAVSTSRACCA